jgi:hypothetical protein
MRLNNFKDDTLNGSRNEARMPVDKNGIILYEKYIRILI